MKIFIGCSSSDKIPEKYKKDCENYLSKLFKEENDLVFGAYDQGIMGLCYNIARENKRHIIGVCPKIYEKDIEKLICEKRITNSTNERTSMLIEESDAIIFLPGGIGTMQELFTAIEIKRSKEINKPIIIYNSNGFFDELLILLEKIYQENFADSLTSKNYHISNSIEDTLEYLNNSK